MIKMLVQIRRAPDLDEACFHQHWRSTHAEIVRRHAPATGVVRYVQARRIASPAIDAFAASRGWRQAPDGQAELWWPSPSAMLEAMGSEEAAGAGTKLRADEQIFTDPTGLCGVMARPETVFDHSARHAKTAGTPVKMVIEVWRRPDMKPEAFSARWRGAHADLARQIADAMGFVRYVQNHRAWDFPIDLATTRGWRPSPDGVSELWWASEDTMMEALSKPEAAEASALLQADEAKFVHAPLMSAFLSIEREIFDRTRDD